MNNLINDNIKFILKKENIQFKHKLLLILKQNGLNIEKEEKSSNYFVNFTEIQNILNILNHEDINIQKFLYDNINDIHSILYDEEEVIILNSFKINQLKNLFYLYQIIAKSSAIINYTYTFDFINKIVNLNISQEKKITKIVCKIITNLIIKNFENFDEYDEEKFGKDLQKIKDDNIKSIEENKSVLDEFNISLNKNNIDNININEIYSQIIIGLIKQKKFANYEYIKNIIEQLDLENIDITKEIFNDLSNMMTETNEYTQYYQIEQKQDLFNEEKINFYYILFKYILKDPIYIYHLEFLLKTRKIIIELIKNKELSNEEINNNEKIKNVIQFIVDSQYYFKIEVIPNNDNIKLNEVLKYLKNCFFESKKNEINEIEDILKRNRKKYKDYKKYLNIYEGAESINNKFALIKLFHTLKSKNEDNYTEEELNESINSWNILEKLVKDKKIKKKMRSDDKNILIKIFNDKKNKDILLKVFNQETIDYFINEAIKNEKNQNKEQKNEKQIINNSNNFNNNNYISETPFPQETDNTNEKTGSTKPKTNGAISFNNEGQISTGIKSIGINKESNNINANIIGNKDLEESAPSVNENYDDTIAKYMLENSSILTSYNPKSRIQEIIYEKIMYGKNNINIANKDFKSSFGNYYNKDKKTIKNKTLKNYVQFYSFLKEFEDRVKNEYENRFNLSIKLTFSEEKEINDNEIEEEINDNEIKNITCIYTFFEPITNKPFCFREKNILINGTNSELTGFDFLLTKINQNKYKDIDNKDSIEKIIKMNENSVSKKKSSKSEDNNSIGTKDNSGNNNSKEDESKDNIVRNISNNKILNTIGDSNEKSFFIFSDLNKKANKENILEFIKIIDTGCYYNGFFKQLSNGWYATYKSDNNLYIYDIYFNYMMDIKGFKETLYNICERVTNDNKGKKLEIIGCMSNEIDIIQIDLKGLDSSIKRYNLEPKLCYNLVEMKESNYFFLGENGVIQYLELFNKNYLNKNNIKNKAYIGCIKINENICAFTSNIILPKGEDKLFFYNIKTKKISNEIEGYSFVMSTNGLSIMEKNFEVKNTKNADDKKKKKKKNKSNNNTNINEIKNKVLICACKKYCQNQSNGLLLVNADLSNNINIKNPFYETYDFEVNCICPLSIIDNEKTNYNNINEEYKERIKVTYTDYFLVGGFDKQAGEGKIKLYKLIYSDDVAEIAIEYQQDIEFDENFEGFNGSIGCITQSKISGNIIINCFDGKIYLLTKPNIDFYLEKDSEKNENNNELCNFTFNRKSVIEEKENQKNSSNNISTNISKIEDFLGNMQNSCSYRNIFKENFFDNLDYVIINPKNKNNEKYNSNYLQKEKEINLYKREDLLKEGNDIIIYDSFKELTKFIDKIKNIKEKDEIEFDIELKFTENKENMEGKLKNINCEYNYLNLKKEDTNIFQDKDILNDENNTNNFNDFIKKNKSLKIGLSSISQKLNYYYSSSNTLEIDLNKKLSKIKCDSIPNYIKVLSQNLTISGDGENMYFYGSSNIILNKEKVKNDNIFKIEGTKNNEFMEFVITSNKDDNIKLLMISKDINKINEKKIKTIKENMKTRICFQFNKDFILCDDDGVYEINDLTSNITRTKKTNLLKKQSYWTGIKINKELIALTSNKNFLPNGEDKVIFYNYFEKKIVGCVENYSFTLSQNTLALMPKKSGVNIEQDKNINKILLCACKKYEKDQKNGILLLNLDLSGEFRVIYETFHETQNFEVYCLCPLFNLVGNEIVNRENNELIETNQFLVGGFNSDTNKGMIKLYEVNYNNDNHEKLEIKFIKDFETGITIKEEKTELFKGYITCITQSKYDRKLLVTCSDENIYSFNLKDYS